MNEIRKVTLTELFGLREKRVSHQKGASFRIRRCAGFCNFEYSGTGEG